MLCCHYAVSTRLRLGAVNGADLAGVVEWSENFVPSRETVEARRAYVIISSDMRSLRRALRERTWPMRSTESTKKRNSEAILVLG
jgi:hypothetical protein